MGYLCVLEQQDLKGYCLENMKRWIGKPMTIVWQRKSLTKLTGPPTLQPI